MLSLSLSLLKCLPFMRDILFRDRRMKGGPNGPDRNPIASSGPGRRRRGTRRPIADPAP